MLSINTLKNKCFFLLLSSLTLLVGCNNDKSLNFDPQFNGVSVACKQPLHQQPSWTLEQFWFYVSDIQVKSGGKWQSLSMVNTPWQQSNVALIGMHCNESNDNNWTISSEHSKLLSSATTLKFKIAVPFVKNHQNPLKAQGIYDNANMFWTWQQGYKSLRFDLSSSEGESWAFHVGAIGCQSPSVLRAPKNQCRQPNVIDITVTDFDVNIPLTIELAHILTGIEPSLENRCLSMPTQTICQSLITNMNNSKRPVFVQLGLINE